MVRRVLLVDDDPEVISTVQLVLGAHGYEVLAQNEVAGALATALIHRPVVVILDISIQDGAGRDVVRFLRAQPPTLAIPIILLTARSSEQDFKQAFATGVAKYITKPFQPVELLYAVDELVERCRLERA